MTAKFASSHCGMFKDETIDLIQKFLNSQIGVLGQMSMTAEVGDDIKMPVIVNDLSLNIKLKMQEQLVDNFTQLLGNSIENGCKAMAWEGGAQTALLLLLTTLAASGAVLAYHATKQPSLMSEDRERGRDDAAYRALNRA